MSAIANLVAYDAAATAHTFYPISVTREKGKVIALYREAVANVPVEAQGTVQLTQEQLPSGVHKVEVQVAIPVMEAVSGQNAAGYTAAPKIAHTPRIVTTAYFSGRSSSGNRQNARLLMHNLLNGKITDTTAVYSGPAPELVDSLINPT